MPHIKVRKWEAQAEVLNTLEYRTLTRSEQVAVIVKYRLFMSLLRYLITKIFFILTYNDIYDY